MKDITVHQPQSLLADPEQVALVRDLIRHARSVRAEHATYSFGDGTGRRYGPVEHTWTAGEERVSVAEGELIYKRHGVPLLHARHVVHPRQAADLLAAIGVIPQAFTSAYQMGRKDAPAVLAEQPGPEVTEVLDIDGEAWQRDHNGNGWRYHGYGDATAWRHLVEVYGPITAAPQGGAS